MRALITGIGGFVGRHLTAHLLDAGDEVHGLDLVSTPIDGVSGVHACDITDAPSVAGAVAEIAPDVIYHLAGAASAGASFADPIGTWHLNLDGTLNVLEAVRTGIPTTRLVTVTSAEIYGLVPVDALPVTEDTPMRPHSPYGASKLAADIAARQYSDGFGLDVVRVRPFNHTGPGQDGRFLVPSIARQIAAGEGSGDSRIEVRAGNLDTRRDFMDVRDVVRAYRMIADRGARGGAYVIGTGCSRRVGDLVEALAGLAAGSVSVISDATLQRVGEQPDLYGSADQLTRDTGWRPEIPLDSTLRDTLQWWRARIAPED